MGDILVVCRFYPKRRKGEQMKQIRLMQPLALVLGFVLILVAAGPVFGAPPVEAERVWVEYAPGAAASVQAELHRYGAELHYQFADLNAHVATLPLAAVNGLRRNPNIFHFPTAHHIG